MKYRWSAIIALLAFTSSALASTATFPSYLVKNTKELASLKKEIDRPGKSSAEKAWLRWQYALNAPQLNYVTAALKILKQLQSSKQSVIGQDQISLTRGRILFQQGKFDDAVEAYQEVPKTSEYWFEAIEEEAWSYIRLNEPERATAKLTTLFSPVFSTWVGPESYFAANYNALKTCDYNAIFKNGKTFKKRHGDRIAQLEQLVKTGTNSQIGTVIPRLESGEMNFLAYAKEATALPRFFWRDEFLRRHVTSIQNLKKNKSPEVRLKKVRDEIVTRLQALAKAELSEYSAVIQKMHIIEAEVIQRMYLDESLKGERPEVQTTSSDPNILTFPYNDESQKGELWLDEIDSYQASVKSCPQMKEAKL
ncbi:MAG: tetratricopeptide repeat protein [Bdellovibrionales bacterium]